MIRDTAFLSTNPICGSYTIYVPTSRARATDDPGVVFRLPRKLGRGKWPHSRSTEYSGTAQRSAADFMSRRMRFASALRLLTQYDLSAMRLVRFEFQPKSDRVNMRLPRPLLDAVKASAAKAGVPYQRFIRQALEAAVQSRRRG